MTELSSVSALLAIYFFLAFASSSVSLDLVGRGASFPELVYLDAAFFYNLYNPDVSVTYYPTGSGSGKAAIQQDPPEVDFAGSDSLLKDSEYDAYPDLQMFPTLAGAVVPIYNIPEIAQSGITEPLVLDRIVLADIFLGAITKWNDARIVADNAHLSGILPDQNISVIVRLDKSGTTEIFTSGLDAFSSDFHALYSGEFSKPEVWSGSHINFAVSSGNSGLARTVLLRPYAIGYVTLGTARDKKLPYASIKNKAGRVIEANEDSLAFSIMEFGGDLDPARLTASLSDGAGQNVWPIAGYTYLVLRQRMTNVDCTKREAVLAFWTWFYESSTVADIAAGYGFATLPSFVRNIAMTKLRENFLCNGVVVEKSRSTLSVSVNSGILVDYLNFIYAGYSVSGVSGSDTPYSTTSDNLFYGGPNSLMFTVNRTKAIAAVEGGSVALILTADEASSYSASSSSAGSGSAVFETMDATDLAYPSSASSRALQGDLSSEYSVLSSSSSSTSDLAVEEIGRLGVTLNFNIDGLQSCLESVQGFGLTVDDASLSYIFGSASGVPVWNDATILAVNPGMSTCLANVTSACGGFGISRILPRLNGNTFPFIHALSAFLTRQGITILPSDIVDRAEVKAVNFFTTGETLDATACSLAALQISKTSSSESNSIRLALGSQVLDATSFSTSTREGAAIFLNMWPMTVPILGIVPGSESLYSGVKCTTSVTRMIRFLGWMNSTASSTVKDRAWSNKGIFLNDNIIGSVPAVSISQENGLSNQASIKSGSTSPPRFVSVLEMTSWCDGFECPVGTFGTVGTACQPCPAGEVAVSVGSSSCHVCSAGTFVPPNTVASACSPCASGTYQASSGSTSCNQCPANTKTVSVGSTSIQDCVCKEDYYNPAGPGNACEACPVGATCAGGINPPVPVEGYWSVLSEVSELVKNQVDQAEIASLTPSLWEQTNESGSLWACLNSQACPGGDLGNMGNCSLGYEGRFCSVCSVGYFSFATTCFACTNMSERYDVVVIIIMLVVIGAWMGLNRLIALNIDAMDISLVFLQVTAIIGSYDLNWKTELKGIFQALTFVNFNVDLLSPQCLTGEYSYFQKYLINIFLPYAYIGILMALYGIVFGIYKATGGAGGKFGLREVVRRSFRRLSKPHIYSSKKRVANSETQVVPFNENGEDTEGRKPEDEGIELARRNDNSIKNSRSGSNKVPEEGIKREATWKNMDLLLQGHKHKTFTREERMAMFGGVILSNCGSFLDITYASVTEMVFRTFACERMGDKFILRADPSLFCYISPEHQAMMVISGISIVLFVIGVPVLVFAILRYGKTKFLMNEVSFRSKFGWSFVRFKEDYWWWQIMWHFKRVVFILVAVFIQNGVAQALTGMLLIVIFCLFHFSNLPFHLSYLDYLEGFLLVGSFVILVAGVYFSSERFDAELQSFADDVFVASLVVLAIFLLAMIFAILMNFSHFFMSRYVSRLLLNREKTYSTGAKGRAKGLLLKRLSIGNIDTTGVMADDDRQKAIAAAFDGGMARVNVLKNSRLDEQLSTFSKIFKPLRLVPWVKDPASDFEAFRELSIISEVVTTSDFAADRDLYEANRAFYRKITKAMPEIIDWLAFTSRADLIVALAGADKDKAGSSGNNLSPVVAADELALRQSLADGMEALRRSWVNIRIRFVQDMRKKKMGVKDFLQPKAPEGFNGVRKVARGRASIGNVLSAQISQLDHESGESLEGLQGGMPDEDGTRKNETGRRVGKYQGRSFKIFLPEKRQYMLQLLVDSYNRKEAPALVRRLARVLKDM